MAMDLPDLKRFLIGAPFPTSQEMHERLDKMRALAVFASDPISSNAYATEAIMSVLIVLGSGALRLTLPLAMGVAALVLMVIFSYIQTILHYPDGGGAYTVAKDNLGKYPSLLAGGALLTDYILTVSVSVAAGVRAVTSALPAAYEYRVLIALAGHCPDHLGQPARRARKRDHLRGADLCLCGRGPGDRLSRPGALCGLFGLAPLPTFAESVPATDLHDRLCLRLAAAARLCRRLYGPDRHRGDQQRRQGVQTA